jgi:hypothetical protein
MQQTAGCSYLCIGALCTYQCHAPPSTPQGPDTNNYYDSLVDMLHPVLQKGSGLVWSTKGYGRIGWGFLTIIILGLPRSEPPASQLDKQMMSHHADMMSQHSAIEHSS